jgi:hypothetical protein
MLLYFVHNTKEHLFSQDAIFEMTEQIDQLSKMKARQGEKIIILIFTHKKYLFL